MAETQEVTNFQKISRWVFSLIGAVSCWKMAYTLYQTWQTPMVIENGRWVSLGIGIMVMEFILVHSGVMLPALASSKNLKPLGQKPILFVSILYIIFGVAYSFIFKSTMLFWTFTGIMIPRWMSLVLDPDTAREQQIQRSLESFLLYFGAVMLSIFVQFPRGGLSPEVLHRVYPNPGSGIWEEHPQQVLVAGAVYFTLIGLTEITSPIRKRSFVRSPITGGIVLLVILYTIGRMFFA